MSEVQVKLDGESKPVTDVPVQPVQPVAVKPVQPVAPPPATSTVAPSTETVESPLDDELPQRIEPIQSTGMVTTVIKIDFALRTFALKLFNLGVRLSSDPNMDQLDGDNPLKNMKIPDNMVPTTENLEKLKRWGLKHYRVNRQRVQELMGTATITTEPELEPRVEKLQQQLIKYKELHMVCNFCQDTVTFDPDLWFFGENSRSRAGADALEATESAFIYFLVGRRIGKSFQCTDNNTKENGRFLSRNEFEVKRSSR